MGKEIRSLGHIKTLMGMKHRSLPKADRANDAEIYLLRNNLSLSLKELGSVTQRKHVIEERISDIQSRIEMLERERTENTRDVGLKKIIPKNKNMKVMKIEY